MRFFFAVPPRIPRPPRPRLSLPRPKRPRLRLPRRKRRQPTRSTSAGLSPLARYRLEQTAIASVAALAGAGAGVGITLALDDEDPTPPAPEIVVSQPLIDVPDTAQQLGFPGFATRNTTRVAGEDPTVDAAGAALAAFPAGAGVEGPAAVTLVGTEDWTGAVAASALVADPVAAPILVAETDSLPDFTADAIEALDPRGSAATERAQIFRVGDVAIPDGLRDRALAGANPAETAVGIAALRRRLAGPPHHFVVASSDQPEYAMPAAAWAARSGDPVLFAQRSSVPDATLRELRRNDGVPVYVLGPETVISAAVERELETVGGPVQRVAGADPVTNAIEFARFADGTFGWDINDPGHGFVIANSGRPLDAAAAASLSSRGKPGPLLLTDDAAAVPPALRGFLLDTKPGYFDDPTRAVYNHLWLIGDTRAMGIAFQIQVDELTNLAPVGRGSGAPTLVD